MPHDKPLKILLVDDEPLARSRLRELLADIAVQFASEVVGEAGNGLAALDFLRDHAVDVVLADIRMPGMDGIELVKKLKASEDPPTVIVMTAFGAVQSAIDALRAGAAEYLTKPLNFDELLIVIERALEHAALGREARRLRQRVTDKTLPKNIVGVAPPMQRVFEIVDQVAPSKATVLITGESGTGKELVANAIHERSPRTGGPFVKLHCAALAETLLESELFGHERGAFTGAVGRKDGRFQMADGGTLFLDEIGEISPAVQVKLLRFLQEHEFERVGGTQTVRVDVRVIAATNRNLVEEVKAGRFREDLYYRLNVVAIEIPPLRDRRSDIPALAKFFVDRYAGDNGKKIDGLAAETIDLIGSYDWPGNVRELENAIERAVVMCTGNLIEPKHLPASVVPNRRTIGGAPVVPGASMADLERYAILETLKATGGSTSKAAEILGISVRTIQYRLHEYNAAPRSDAPVVKGGSRTPHPGTPGSPA